MSEIQLQLPNLVGRFSTANRLATILTFSGVTLGLSAAFATPAHAAFLYNTDITFNSNIPTFYSNVQPVTQVPPKFDTNFGTAVMVSSSQGTLSSAPFFTPALAMYNFSAPAPTATFINPTGTDAAFSYVLESDINFQFANGLDVVIAAGTQFNGSRNASAVELSTIDPTGSYFFLGGDKTFIDALSFGLNDILGNGNSTYGITASTGAPPTAVPEPFTIVGTSIGAITAFRMRKKLAEAKLG
jgi:hypothetical protein